MKVIESGNVAAATGVMLSRAQVIAAYPITPQTPLTEKLSEMVNKLGCIPREELCLMVDIALGLAADPDDPNGGQRLG